MYSKKPIRALFVAAFALIFSPVLAAKGLEYSYADVGYVKYNGDDYDYHGGTVNISFGTFDLVALRLGYTRARAEKYPKNQDPTGNPDVSEFRFGLRPHYSLAKTLDVYGDLGYANAKFNGDRSKTNIGWIYAAGMRWQALKWAELNLAAEYQSGNIDEAFLVVGPVFKLTKNFDLSLSTSQSSDDAYYFGGIRINF